jgi:hypothetical protein
MHQNDFSDLVGGGAAGASPPGHLAGAPCPPPGAAHGHPSSSRKGWRALFWGISGGTILSAVGFIALALFEQYNDGLTELRNDLKHFHLTYSDLVKKESLQRWMEHTRDSIKEIQKELQATAAARALRELRLAQLEREIKEREQERKEMEHELQQLRERLAGVEGRQAAFVVPAPSGK